MKPKHPPKLSRILAGILLTAVPLVAQTDPAAVAKPDESAAATKTEEAATLEPLVVTATLREESLQKVPVAVTVVDGAEAEAKNLNNLFDIASEVPALTFRTNSSNKDTTLLIRGIGTVTTSPGVEPSVSTVIDGVALARPGQATLDLFDIDRVEVLRGPQGTLFGKNASAGVINIVTRDPESVPGGYIDTSWYEDDEIRTRVSAWGGNQSGNLRGSINLLYGNYDGNVDNVHDGSTVNGYEKKGFRGKFVYSPIDTVKLTFAADYLKTEIDNAAVPVASSLVAFPTGVVTSYPAYAAAIDPVVPNPESRTINSDFRTYVDDENWGLSGTAEIKLGEFILTSITAYRGWKNTQYQDGDRTPGPLWSHDKGILDISQFSQEIRLTSPSGEFLKYVAGLYYFTFDNDEIYRRDVRQSVSGAYVDNYGRADYGTNSDSYAIFGEATINFTDRFRLIAGARATFDELEYYHSRYASATGVPGVAATKVLTTDSTSETGFSGRTGLQFDVTKDITVYGTYSRGYKGPAYNVFFNQSLTQGEPLEPETSDNFEIGVKTSLFDNRLDVNLAAFDSTYHDFQADFAALVNGTPVTNLVNAGEVTTRGLELDLLARPTSALRLRAGAAWTHARIDDFPAASGGDPSFAINGKPLPFSPDWKVTLGGSYRIALGSNYAIDIATDYNWQSEVQYSLRQYADTIQDAYGVWNGSIGLVSLSSGWNLTFHVRNIADTSYAAFLSRGSNNVARIVPRDDQRYVGISFRKDF